MLPKFCFLLTKYLQGKVKNDNKITLTAEAKQAFLEIKTALAQAAGLAHPRKDATLRLYTDTSTVAMSAMLAQKLPHNTEQALAFFSKALNDTQRRYSVFDLELLAVHSAVKHFEHMLLDRSFTIVTDHLSLVHAFQKPSLPIRRDKVVSSPISLNSTARLNTLPVRRIVQRIACPG